MNIIFVTGGVRSGKSLFAEQLAKERGTSVLYVATGVNTDPEMGERIKLHQARRPADWELLEATEELGDLVPSYFSFEVVLIDCLSTWLTNQLVLVPEEKWQDAEENERILARVDDWLAKVKVYRGTVIVVSSETGLGGVAMSKLGRWFGDLLGSINQRIAAAANEAYVVLSGIPWRIKG
jgi:adenosylcobinamide kinase / adenosylcobinamide-phosphate guanylyltransferase